MGILFKHQEDLEHAAKANKNAKKQPVVPPPPPAMDAADLLEPVHAVEPKPVLIKKDEAPKKEPVVAKPEVVVAAAVPVPVPVSVPPALSVARAVTRPDTDARFSPEEFLKLMRSLPVSENAALIVRVVEATLASVKVKMSDLLPEIARRESVLHDRIEAVQKRIEDLEVELVEQRTELSLLEAELSETSHIKSLLNLTKATINGTETKAPGFHRDASVDETLVLAQPARA